MAGDLLGSAASSWGVPGLWSCLFVQRKQLRGSMDSACRVSKEVFEYMNRD